MQIVYILMGLTSACSSNSRPPKWAQNHQVTCKEHSPKTLKQIGLKPERNKKEVIRGPRCKGIDRVTPLAKLEGLTTPLGRAEAGFVTARSSKVQYYDPFGILRPLVIFSLQTGRTSLKLLWRMSQLMSDMWRSDLIQSNPWKYYKWVTHVTNQRDMHVDLDW